MENENVSNMISLAFKGARRGRIGLREAEAIGEYRDDAVILSRRALDTELSSDKIPEVVLLQFWGGIFYVDPVSWVFLMGAYMSLAVRKSDREASEIREGLVLMLIPDADSAVTDWMSDRYDRLTPDQVVAVVHFLRHMEQSKLACRRDAGRVLRDYWMPRAAKLGK